MILMNLITFLKEMTKKLDKGRSKDIVYMAFDKVLCGWLVQKAR